MAIDQNIEVEDVSVFHEELKVGVHEWGVWKVVPRIWAKYENGVGAGTPWHPDSLVNHTKEFVDWINSITYGIFPNMLVYDKYELYKAETFYWLNQRVNPTDISDPNASEEAMLEELRRCDRNSLYFACKYGHVKEGNMDSGMIKYRAKEHNAFLLYLIDCGYCLLIGKPRQIFATTTLGLFAIKRLVTRFNYYMKFITSSDDKGVEIVRDKFKFAFEWIPYWMKHNVIGDSLNKLHLGDRSEKGKAGFPNSMIEQVAPSSTAINGGAPQMTLLDEIGELPSLIDTLFEIRPTLFMDIDLDGELKLVRQIIAWGTGVTNNAGKQGFEKLWMSTISLWEDGKYRAALFVPVFMSWHCRASKRVYDEEKMAYMAGTANADLANLTEKEREEIFHMHYPSGFRDMFGTSSNLLVDRETIIKHRERIRSIKPEMRPVLGYFEPIYDRTKPEPENSDTPFKIIGATWWAADDCDDSSKISCMMMLKPDRDWVNRYYQGTDPIANETGVSFMASGIWDRHIQSNSGRTEGPVCLIYHRKSHDPKCTYLQCVLMGLYYDTNNPEGAKLGVPELIENNIGTNYKEYKENKGFYKSVVYNGELPDNDMMGGGAKWGINTSGRGQNRRKMRVVSKTRDIVVLFGQNVHFDVFWKELETYVNLMKSDETWAPIDKRMYRDDALDGITFSYICSLCFPHLVTRKVSEGSADILKTVYKYVRKSDGQLVYEPIRIVA